MKLPRFFARLMVLLALLLALPAAADESGGAFFLLSDASYGSNDQAMVRLEVQDLGAVAQNGGVDVYVYRVTQPLEFLKAQKNLHRINVEGNHVGEGLANVLANAWDSLTPLSRNEWICWVTIVKKAETRKEHIVRMKGELLEGKRRPCCWPGCPHRRPDAAKWFSPKRKTK